MATVSSSSSTGGSTTPCLLNTHVLLLGYRGSGKTSSCITITGQKRAPAMQPSTQAVLYMKIRACRRLLLVDTPGWSLEGGNVVAEGLYEQIRQLCYPGVHVLLLVVPVAEPFTEQHRRGMLERLECAGIHVQSFCMVLFTGADRLWGNSVEECIVEGGTALQMLVKMCGNRYHALDNTSSQNSSQVTELLQKVDEILEENGGTFIAINEKIQAFWPAQSWREEVRHWTMTDDADMSPVYRSPPQELRMLLMGWKGAGKSSAANMILGEHRFQSGQPTEASVIRRAYIGGRRISIVDTPGWDWSSIQKDTQAHIRREIRQGAGLLHPGPHVLLLVIPVTSVLTCKQRQALEKLLEMFGKDVSLHTMVLFSWGDSLAGMPVEEQIQRNGAELLSLMEYCLNCYHVLDSTNAARGREQVSDLLNKVDEMVTENKSPFLHVTCREEQTTCGKCTLQ